MRLAPTASAELAGLQIEALRADAVSSAQVRHWQPDPGGGFNPHGYFVYCLWGDDHSCPIYVGQSTNVMGRLGSHVNTKGAQIRCVTLLRCRSQRQMEGIETRMIDHYQPPLNIRGTRGPDMALAAATA